MIKTTNWWFMVNGEDSPLCGEEFIVQVETEISKARDAARAFADELFPAEHLKCMGRLSDFEAEMMGIDTYTAE